MSDKCENCYCDLATGISERYEGLCPECLFFVLVELTGRQLLRGEGLESTPIRDLDPVEKEKVIADFKEAYGEVKPVISKL